MAGGHLKNKKSCKCTFLSSTSELNHSNSRIDFVALEMEIRGIFDRQPPYFSVEHSLCQKVLILKHGISRLIRLQYMKKAVQDTCQAE